ncbi:hypothetical protein KCU73_g4, partial [Aureobasidium melanogenum]
LQILCPPVAGTVGFLTVSAITLMAGISKLPHPAQNRDHHEDQVCTASLVIQSNPCTTLIVLSLVAATIIPFTNIVEIVIDVADTGQLHTQLVNGDTSTLSDLPLSAILVTVYCHCPSLFPIRLRQRNEAVDIELLVIPAIGYGAPEHAAEKVIGGLDGFGWLARSGLGRYMLTLPIDTALGRLEAHARSNVEAASFERKRTTYFELKRVVRSVLLRWRISFLHRHPQKNYSKDKTLVILLFCSSSFLKSVKDHVDDFIHEL